MQVHALLAHLEKLVLIILLLSSVDVRILAASLGHCAEAMTQALSKAPQADCV